MIKICRIKILKRIKIEFILLNIQKERDILSSSKSILLAENEDLKNSLSSLRVEMKNERNKGSIAFKMFLEEISSLLTDHVNKVDATEDEIKDKINWLISSRQKVTFLNNSIIQFKKK
jgi:hypothetical protein